MNCTRPESWGSSDDRAASAGVDVDDEEDYGSEIFLAYFVLLIATPSLPPTLLFPDSCPEKIGASPFFVALQGADIDDLDRRTNC